MLIDSHCHLDYWTVEELPALLERARMAGVDGVVTIGTGLDQSRAIAGLAARHKGVWSTVGIHPHNAGDQPVADASELVRLAQETGAVGIGESGLDYFYDKAPRDAQRESFRQHIRAARELALPLVVHARDADEDIGAILREEREGGTFQFILHCFSSGRALAEAAVGMGGYVSFSGILTFPRSEELRDIARGIPADRLLVETDAPYLAPVPNRGKRNEPAFVAHTAKVLAGVRGMEIQQLSALTTGNFKRLFGMAG